MNEADGTARELRGPLAWLARNSVAANLLMALLIAGGLAALPEVQVEVFPEIASDRVVISVPYPGASPEELEGTVLVKLEEEVWDVDGIEEITSTAVEGLASVQIEVRSGVDARRVLDDVKVRVDAIETFPEEAERPRVEEVVLRKPVIDVALFGPATERALKRLAEDVRDELTALEGVTQADLVNVRPYQITIELSEEALVRHGLAFERVAAAVRRSSLDLPGGSLRTAGGEVLLRVESQAYSGEEFAALPLLERPDGTRLVLGDVARIDDGFAETDQQSRFDGQPAAQVRVYRVGDQSALEVARAVREYVDAKRGELPGGLSIAVWQDQSVILADRLSLMLRNGFQGLALVFAVLALFLRFRLAIWVSIGIPIAFLASLATAPALGVSINLVSLFAYILVLGIVVDDAIVVGESVHREQERGETDVLHAVRGARRVAGPVVFAVLTTVVAFLPMAMLEGFTGRLWRIIPLVVIPTLLASLVESLAILPAHLSHPSAWMARWARRAPFRWWVRFQGAFAAALEGFAQRIYLPFVRHALHWRYAVLGGGVGLVLVTVAVVLSGRLRFEFFPAVEADLVAAQVRLPEGTPVERTREVALVLEQTSREVLAELEAESGEELLRHSLTALGSQPFRADQSANGGRIGEQFTGANLGEVTLELQPAEVRSVSSTEIARRWRERVGELPGVSELEFVADLISSGKPVHVRFGARTEEELTLLSARFRERLAAYPGVYGISDTLRGGQTELTLDLTDEGRAAGLSRADLALQLRSAFFGLEAQRVQRGRDEVEVRVRYPADRRRALTDLESMRIRTATGLELPFASAVRVTEGRGATVLQRADRRRSIEVTADVDPAVADANRIRRELEGEVLPELMAAFPSASWTFVGEQQEQQESLETLLRYYALALLGIFGLMAVPFRSYLQPLIVMSAIPFGLVGAVGGHLLTGHTLSMLSVLGIIALGGVVVNDSLVLVHRVNRLREEHESLHEAVSHAGLSRFRAIVLTSMTTFAGLTPLMLERSMQAQFLIPMAISLAFGVLFATLITLVLVPCIYYVLEDVQRVLGIGSDGA